MIRKIVDFKKLTPELLGLLNEKYPDGYDEDDTINFRNAANDLVECLEIKTEDAIYLVKVSQKLADAMADFEPDSDDDDSDDDPSFETPEEEN